MGKPEFYIPTLEEIRAVEKPYKAISTFSGCGGSSLGYQRAGFDVVWASEFVPAAAEVYELNHTGHLNTQDIRDVTPEQMMEEAGVEKGELDLMGGSPPCAAFSHAGRRDKEWGKVKRYSETEQRVDDLFFEYARLVEALQPKVFVAENVKGLVEGRAKGYFKSILARLKECGYKVSASLLDASYLGVPQMRVRLFFMGVRDDLGIAPVFPTPKDYQYTVRDVLPYIAHVKHGSVPFNWKTSDTPAPTIMQSDANRKETAYLSGGGWIKEVHDNRLEKRKFTIDELKVLSTFPEDFEITGSFEQRWERIGRAVPPTLSYELAKTIRQEILER